MSLERQSRVLRDLVTGVFAILACTFVMIVWFALQRGQPVAQWLLIHEIPTVFYLTAIWMVRRALAALAKGALFDAVVSKLLARVGWALAGGGLSTVFVTPNLMRFFANRGSFATFDVGAITLGVVGFALILVARLLERASEMRAELDEIL